MRGKLLENVISQLEDDIVKSEMDGKYARMKTNEQEPTDATDYEEEVDQTNIMPSIRDNEYIEHSSLWGSQYMSGILSVFSRRFSVVNCRDFSIFPFINLPVHLYIRRRRGRRSSDAEPRKSGQEHERSENGLHVAGLLQSAESLPGGLHR